jgi:hypothetical protein
MDGADRAPLARQHYLVDRKTKPRPFRYDQASAVGLGGVDEGVGGAVPAVGQLGGPWGDAPFRFVRRLKRGVGLNLPAWRRTEVTLDPEAARTALAGGRLKSG